MEIYTRSAGAMTIAWANHVEYKLGDKFLTDMGVLRFPPDGDKLASFYLENAEQLEALLEFRRSLRQKSSDAR